jgi:hypothetical protein
MANPTADPITKELDDLHRQAKTAKRLFEPNWLMDLAYYENRQWMAFAGDRLQEPQLAANRITVTENRITGCIRTELAKMTKNRPVFTVTPNTGDEEDANAAQLAERLMRYMWRHLKMHEFSLKGLEWSRVCAAGFLKCFWDPTIGDAVDVLIGPDGQVLPDPQTGKPMRGDQQAAATFSQVIGQQVTSKRISQGDVRVSVASPFQMFIDPICDTFPEAEWVIEESVKSREYCLKRYGDKAQGLKADTPANPGLVQGRLMGAQPSRSEYMGVKLREYWCKPSSKHPNGCRMVWSQGIVLASDEKPFDPMPYVMLTGVPVPGRLWPMSVVELLRGPQTELNKIRSQIAENRNRIANPTLLVSKQAVQDAEKFLESTMVPGGAYFYDDIGSPNALPRFLEPPNMPEYVAEDGKNYEQAIEDISGQHEVTNANVPPGVTAASAITLLQEADDTRLGLAIQDYEEQIGRFGSKILDLVANFYSDARTVKIAGDDGAWEIVDFKGAMLRGNTHVEVQAGSAFPQSKAQKQAMITDIMTFLVQSGNAPHGRQLAQFLRDTGMGASDALVDEYTTTETQVNRENTLMSLGQQLQTNPYDDDQAHVDGHQDFQRSSRYAAFSPQVQQIVEQHTDMHRQKLQMQQQQELQNQLALAGEVPPGLSNAAFQDEQQLAQLQGLQQQQGTAQQQGFDAAGAEQDQRQKAEAHQQSQLSMAQQQRLELEKHHQALQHAEELHQTKLQQMKQSQQQPQRRAS